MEDFLDKLVWEHALSVDLCVGVCLAELPLLLPLLLPVLLPVDMRDFIISVNRLIRSEVSDSGTLGRLRFGLVGEAEDLPWLDTWLRDT